MSGLREKFVYNVRQEGHLDTPDEEHFYFNQPQNYSLYPQEYNYQYTQEDVPPRPPLKEPPYVRTRGLQTTQNPQYYTLRASPTFYGTERMDNVEMDSLSSDPFSGSPDDSPRQGGQNPFEETPQDPFAAGAYSSYPLNETPEDTKSDSHARLLRRQERNRRKLEARLPRFHYTKLPWFTMLVSVIQLAVFIAELARMTIYTGSAFQTKPYFNPMLGPSTYVIISMGARYVPCMHRIDGITLDTLIQYPCPNSTSEDTNVCSLAELCSLSGVPIVDDAYAPNQWYRVVTPIFLHAGFLHILFNMLLQVSVGVTVERSIGWIKYSVIYLASGVAGFLLGANFSPNGIALSGALGALFGVIATNLLLFVYCGRENTNTYATRHYRLFIVVMVLEIVVLFVLGLLPGLDNFSHIGGFCMGLLLSVALLKDPSFVYNEGIYVYDPDATTMQLFRANWNPMNNWAHKVQWKVIVWTILRAVCVVLAALYFALLFVSLYSKRMESTEVCSWCKYLSCIPVNGWCDQGEVSVETVSSGSSSSMPSTATATATTLLQPSLPTSIENLNSKRFYAFSQPATGYHGNEQNTIVLFAILGILGVRYLRRSWH